MMLPDFNSLSDHFSHALQEDLGDADHSVAACIDPTYHGKAHLLVKEDGVIAGVALARHLFGLFDPQIDFEQHIADGQEVRKGDIVFVVSGPSGKLLSIERLVLNYMQRLSGIASQSRVYAEAVKGTGTQILDTRKTTPGLRILEKWAVQLGGCSNHRMGLYDMIMLKDNHIDFCGSVAQAIRTTRAYLKERGLQLKIEIEVRNMDELEAVLNEGGVDRIMLDNFSIQQTRAAVQRIDGRFETESSGGIDLKTVAHYAACGVDYISVGALTHQIGSLDLSLKAIEDK
ncbi:MAG: Nicotinate-nucleotide pyrophosphorylase [carboxylating] [Flavobacteriia bacterium]|nr:MAG: Nicotinate-nucleotide pyrophosphorylase [carboxylating] [Flavobacteriia bacterium]